MYDDMTRFKMMMVSNGAMIVVVPGPAVPGMPGQKEHPDAKSKPEEM